MPKLEMFFDYSCPYCLEGYEILQEVLAEHPNIEMQWLPCEAHPRPEVWDRHSDLCAMGFYIAKDFGADMPEFQKQMYKAAVTDKEKIDIEDADQLAEAIGEVVEPKAFADALRKGSYSKQVAENNRVCWGECGFEAVPSFRMGDATLSAVWHKGITKEGLAGFIKDNS